MKHAGNPILKSLLSVLLLFGFTIASTEQADGSEVTYTFTGDALEGPEQLEAGFHTFMVQGDAEASLDIEIVKHEEDVTADEIVAAFQAVDQAYAEGGDAVAAFNAALELGELWGGPTTEAGLSNNAGINLVEGHYTIVATVRQEGEEDGPPPASTYITTPLEVISSGDTTEVPQADLTVQMVDFDFALPPDIQEGQQTWEVVNAGDQVHHLVLVRLQEGRTMEDIEAFMEGGEEGEPPVDNVGYVNVLSPGVSNYVNFDLTPGTYIALCFMPDHRGEATGQPHVALGMMESFTIGGEGVSGGDTGGSDIDEGDSDTGGSN